MIACGTIQRTEYVRLNPHDRTTTIVITLSSVDEDPITNSLVICRTRHYLPKALQDNHDVSLLVPGAQVTITGVIKDYNEPSHLWETEHVQISSKAPPPVLCNRTDVPFGRTPPETSANIPAAMSRPISGAVGCWSDFYSFSDRPAAGSDVEDYASITVSCEGVELESSDVFSSPTRRLHVHPVDTSSKPKRPRLQ
ncbi:uncharacterized protein MELLADRAFT_63571 [Melampsora larici-populina 98AG31]|uniref:Uncharacterized protein n=1 Tax=Melampsora larici-populina (strain 98AG31 / pathotype 3-4-7) TaxID=747676 RepID=F4RN50_MELLP|nr:uncharacterized protein MELLADRAFT_63571 [Melampsora larici-populina 98AG31]EGG06280.1 hypothetical protein MELLADRAFT_63571 [Melampsora larici-populina 98AG31]